MQSSEASGTLIRLGRNLHSVKLVDERRRVTVLFVVDIPSHTRQTAPLFVTLITITGDTRQSQQPRQARRQVIGCIMTWRSHGGFTRSLRRDGMVTVCRPNVFYGALNDERSTASRTRVMTQTYSTFGDRAFAAAGTGLWNSLPSHLKDADLSYNRFRRSLKTLLFGQ